jgi:hypothetical protein
MEKRKALYLELKRTYDNGMPIEKIPGGLEQWGKLKNEAKENGWDKPEKKSIRAKSFEKIEAEDLKENE